MTRKIRKLEKMEREWLMGQTIEYSWISTKGKESGRLRGSEMRTGGAFGNIKYGGQSRILRLKFLSGVETSR